MGSFSRFLSATPSCCADFFSGDVSSRSSRVCSYKMRFSPKTLFGGKFKIQTFPAMALALLALLPVVTRRFFGVALGVAAADDDADPEFLAAAA